MTRGSLTDDVVERVRLDPDAPAVAVWIGSRWDDISIAGFQSAVTDLAKGLMASGIAAGDRVALLARSRYEWTLTDYALWWIGAVSVPLYETSGDDLVTLTLRDGGVTAAITEDDAGADQLGSIPVWTMRPGFGRPGFGDTDPEDPGSRPTLADLVAAGSSVSDAELEARRSAVAADDLATIIYTSGTTGVPKGCALTHGNLRAQLDGSTAALHELFDDPDAATLLFLPLAHVLARIVQIGAIRTGIRFAHTADVTNLADQFATFAPTFVLTVPRLLERIFNIVSQQAYADNRGGLFDRAVQTAIAYSRALDGKGPSITLKARYALFDRTVYPKVRAAFGPNIRWAVSGGAPLGERMAHFYRGIGIPVLEGYGLTETAGAVAVNTPEKHRIGTVGRAIPGVEARVASDGELHFRGPQIFQGYWNDPEATHACIDEAGWLATGDLAEIDADGFIRIVGRKTEVLVTAGGKNVSPSILEERIRAHPYVSQCLVVGDGKPFVAALVTIDRDTWTGKLATPELREEIQSAIDEANAVVSQAEAVRRFAILDAEWTEANGYLTPSHKVRRSAVLSDFHDTVEALFVR
ncbi:MAG TPA: long-chain fatty acid--CoA ligase [Aeromicrobium sp.]|nr:long-chain fatty acid--CoA ligase [Aeromicrobium sp.]